MRSGRTTFLKIAFALSSVGALLSAHAADPAPSSSRRQTNNAPEKIEFSRSSSTTPKVPRPGMKEDDQLERFGNVPRTSSQPQDFNAPVAPVSVLPSKAAAEKMFKEWDRRKNWAIPDSDANPNGPLAKREETRDDLEIPGAEKPRGVMNKYLSGDAKKTESNQDRLHGDREKNSHDSRDNLGFDSKRDDADRDEKDDRDSRRDGKDNAESNGLADFNLKNFIRQQNGMNQFVKDNSLPRASQLFRPQIGVPQSPAELRRSEKDRAEHDAKVADFMQLLKPRGGGPFIGANDPINAPDLTRRELNPVTPRTLESSGPSRSPLSGPDNSPAARIQDNNIFGVTGPAAAASSLAPAVTTPVARPDIHSRQVIIEAPRKIGF